MKKCSACKQLKDLNCYYVDNNTKDKLRYKCKTCCNNYNRRIYHDVSKNSIEYKDSRFNYHLNRKYGISLADRNKMLLEQKNKCKICYINFSDSTSTNVDHCHKSGKVRGILCKTCNLTLGKVKENINILQSMIKYLEV